MTTTETTNWVPAADTFGERLLFVRTKLRLSVREIAAEINVPASTLATWERGAAPRDPSPVEIAQRYHQAFGVSRDWLLFGVDEHGVRCITVPAGQDRRRGQALPGLGWDGIERRNAPTPIDLTSRRPVIDVPGLLLAS